MREALNMTQRAVDGGGSAGKLKRAFAFYTLHYASSVRSEIEENRIS